MTLGAVVHLAICKHSKEGSIQHTWACSPSTVHFRWHHLANFSGKWLLPGRWQKLQEAVKQTDVGAARSHRHKTPLIICESYDVLTPHELKTIYPPLFFSLCCFSTFCFPFWGKSVLVSARECTAAGEGTEQEWPFWESFVGSTQ